MNEFIECYNDLRDIIYQYYNVYSSKKINMVDLLSDIDIIKFYIACYENQLDDMKLLYQDCYELYTDNTYKYAYILAYEKKYYDIIEWLTEIKPILFHSLINDDDHITRINIIKMLIDNTYYDDQLIANNFINACHKNDIIMIKWMLENHTNLFQYINTTTLFEHILKYENVNLAELLYQYQNKNQDQLFNLFKQSCLSDRLISAQWLYDKIDNIPIETYLYLLEVTYNKSYDIVNWLSQLIITQFNSLDIFLNMCKYTNTDTFHYMYHKIQPIQFEDLCKGFEVSCENENYHLAQFLSELNSDIIENINIDKCFYKICHSFNQKLLYKFINKLRNKIEFTESKANKLIISLCSLGNLDNLIILQQYFAHIFNFLEFYCEAKKVAEINQQYHIIDWLEENITVNSIRDLLFVL